MYKNKKTGKKRIGRPCGGKTTRKIS